MLIILSGNFGEVSDEEEQREWVRIIMKLQAMKSKLVLLMDLFYLLIVFSQYRSCDKFGILLCSLTRLSAIVKMSTFERKINTLLVSSHDLYWDRKIDKQKRSFHFL